MATVTFQYATLGDGAVTVEYDVSNANWRVSRIRCINNSLHDAVGRIYDNGELVFTAVGPAGETTEWPVSGIQLGWQPDYWNDLTQQWEPSGIEMGTYEFSAQWPGEV